MINLKLIQQNNTNDIKVLADLKLKLMKYHLHYTEKLGINDDELNFYSEQKALATLSQRDSYFIMLETAIIGYVQVEIKNSIMNSDQILFIHGIYIKEQYRNYSYAIATFKYLLNKYNLGIECQCWYDLPAAKIYEKMGFKKIVTHYFFPYKK